MAETIQRISLTGIYATAVPSDMSASINAEQCSWTDFQTGKTLYTNEWRKYSVQKLNSISCPTDCSCEYTCYLSPSQEYECSCQQETAASNSRSGLKSV